jgi:hypothetical protein
MTAALMTTIDENTSSPAGGREDNRKVFAVSIETHIPFSLSGSILAHSAEEAQKIFSERMADDGFYKLFAPPKRMESFDEGEFELDTYSVDWSDVSAEPFDADDSDTSREDEVKASMIAVEVADAKAKAEIERKAAERKAKSKARYAASKAKRDAEKAA